MINLSVSSEVEDIKKISINAQNVCHTKKDAGQNAATGTQGGKFI